MTLVTSPAHGVTLGGLLLMSGGKPVVSSDGYTVQVSRDGTTWGNPEVVISTLITELSAGDQVEETHVGNRQPVLYVQLESTTHAGLVAGDTALSKVVGRPEELVYQPPDPAAPPTVIDVLHSRMDWAWDDFDEVNRRRVWVLTMQALPWGRAATKTITAAVTAVAPSVVDSGSATTNWAATSPTGASVSVVSGAVTSTYNPGTVRTDGFYGTDLRRTATFSVATSKYIGIDWKTSLPAAHSLNINNNPFTNETEVRREPLAGGYTRSWYRASNSLSSVTAISFGVIHPSNATGSATLSIDQVIQANALPAVGTTRQKMSTIFPGGNVRAEGDVLIQHASSGLGQTIVYSHPVQDGYSPSLRQWLSSSAAVTTDAATVSGARNSLVTTPSWFDVPVTALPKGEAHLWARIRLATGSAATVGVFYGIRSVMNGVELDNEEIETTVDLPGSATWVLAPIARVVLPPRYLGVNGRVRIYLLRSTVHDLEIDEAWLFGMEKGRLTVIDCGAGTPAAGTVHNRLRVSAASLANPFGRLEVATAADFSDAITPGNTKILCDQTGHQFDADNGTNIFTVTDGALDAPVSLEHYQRFRAEVV